MNEVFLTDEFQPILTGPGLVQFNGTANVRVNSASGPWFTFRRGDKWDVPEGLTLTASGDGSIVGVTYAPAEG